MGCEWRRNTIRNGLAASVLLLAVACGDDPGAMSTGAGAGTPPAGTPTGGAGMTVGGGARPAGSDGVTPGTAGSGGVVTTPPTAGSGSGSVVTSPGPDGPPITANPHWLSYGNGPKNQFYNAAETKISVETAPMLKQLWSVSLGEITGAPAVVGDRVYVASNSGLYAVNAADGMTIWTATPAIRSTGAPFYDEESKQLIVNAGGVLHGIDAMTGRGNWMQAITAQPNSMGWSSPIVTGDLAVVGIGSMDMGGFKGGVAAFDKMTGEKKFEYTHATSNGASVWSGPGADDEGIIYATTGNNYGVADDRSDSIFALSPMMPDKMLWNFQGQPGDAWSFSNPAGGPDHDFGANPIILDLNGRKLVAAGRKSGEFHLVDRTTGEEIARLKVTERTSQANGGILNSGAYDGKNKLFIASGNEGGAPGSTVAMSADPDKKLAEVWRIKNTGIFWAPLSTANGVCFIPDDTTLLIVNCADGKELNRIMVPGTIGSAPSISEGRVFFGAGFSYQFGGGSIKPGRNLVAVGL